MIFSPTLIRLSCIISCLSLLAQNSIEKKYSEATKLKYNGEFSKAEIAFSDIIKEDSTVKQAYIDRARCRINLEQYDDAQADLNYFRTISAATDIWYLEQARLHFNTKNLKQAYENINNSIQLNSENKEAYFIRGNIFLQSKMYEKAEVDFKNSLEIENIDEKAIAHCFYGLTLYNLGKTEECKKYIQKSLSIKKTANAYYNLALISESSSEKESIKYYTQAIKLDPMMSLSFINRGILYNQKGDTANAMKDWHTVISKSMKNQYMACVNIADEHFKQKKYESCIYYSSLAMQHNPNSAIAYSLRGNSHFALQQVKEALTDFQQLIQIDSTHYVLPYQYLGKYALQTSNYKAAYYYYNHAIAIDSSNAYDFLYRGKAAEELYEYRYAFQDYNKAIKLNTNLIDAHFARAHILLVVKNFNDAKTAYTIIEKDHFPNLTREDQATLYKNLGAANYALFEYKNAYKNFSKAIELNCKQPEMAYYDRANCNINLNNLDGAASDLNMAIKINANLAKPYNSLAKVLALQGKYEEAILKVTQAISLESNNKDFYYTRGTIYYDLRKFKESISDAKKYIKLDSLNSKGYTLAGMANSKIEDFNEAAKLLSKAIELDSTDYEAWFERGKVLLICAKYKFAIFDFSYVVKYNPESSIAWNFLGVSYFKLGRNLPADEYLTKAIKLSPNNPDYYYNRAKLYIAQGRDQSACQDFRKAYELGATDIKVEMDKTCSQ